MNKLLYNRYFLMSIIIAAICTFSILVYNNLNFLITNWFDVTSFSIGLIGIVTTLYNYWRKFNLYINRLWVVLTNASAIWSVSASYEGDISKEKFRSVISKLREKNTVSDFVEITDTSYRLNLSGLSYAIEYSLLENEDDEEIGRIFLRIMDFNSSYEYSIKKLENVIVPNLRIIENNSSAFNTKFSFKIYFEGKNPFVNLITKNIKPNTISNLWYSVSEDTMVGRRDIKITNNTVECTTSDISDFQKSSTNFISIVGG